MDAKAMDPGSVRVSPIAGTWYPGTPRELEKMVDDFLARASQPPAGSEPAGGSSGELTALIAPHAGYAYSGQTAAYTYRQLLDRKFDLVVLLGPSHYEDFGPFAISAKEYYWTPLGQVALDQEFIQDLAKKIQLTRVDQDREHSLEIQLPFLQRILGNFKVVPIMMSLPFYILGMDALQPCAALAATLAEFFPARPFLIVASSDLSHLYDYDAVKKFDARFAELVDAFNIPDLIDYMWRDHECRACGDAPIVATLLTAKQLGADRARVLYRTNSGDVTGNRAPGQYTVGYMSAGVYKSAH